MTIGLWQCLRCEDADAEMAWLVAVGFTEHMVHRNEDYPSVVEHAELIWPTGGGVMLGSDRDGGGWTQTPGTAGTYLVTDEPDAVFERAVAAGGRSVMEPSDKPYGRDGTVSDPEGNLWSFGDYSPV